MKVYTAHIITDSQDHYVWVYAKKPTNKQVIERLWDMEQAADLDWYSNTTRVTIKPTEVIE